MKTNYWLTSALIIAVLSAVTSYFTWRDIRLMQEELNAPKRVNIVSNGQVHSWPVDQKYVYIEKDEK